MTQPPPELREILYRYAPAIQSLTWGLRTVVLEALAPCHEYGICYIAPYSKHVNLGFHHGKDLHDRTGMLEGTGKAMRHIKLKTLSDLDRPELRDYLRQARKQGGLKRPRHRTDGDVVTRVKSRRVSF